MKQFAYMWGLSNFQWVRRLLGGRWERWHMDGGYYQVWIHGTHTPETMSAEIEELNQQDEEIARLRQKVAHLTGLLDKSYGTPCEQIRHEQEIRQERAINDGLQRIISAQGQVLECSKRLNGHRLRGLKWSQFEIDRMSSQIKILKETLTLAKSYLVNDDGNLYKGRKPDAIDIHIINQALTPSVEVRTYIPTMIQDADWKKNWRILSPTDTLQDGDGMRYVLAHFDEPPTPIQKHFHGLTASCQSWHFYRKVE